MADWKWGDQFGDDDDEENQEESDAGWWTTSQRDGLVYLVDATKAMFTEKNEEGLSAFELSIQCINTMIQRKIFSNERSLLGIVFFGTENSKNPSDFKHITIVQDLDNPGAKIVLQLESFFNDPKSVSDEYGHNDGYSISDALWTCSNMFSNCTQKLGNKRVWLFTNNDNPQENNAQLKRQAAAKAEDLHQNGIAVELLAIKQGGGQFDTSIFFNDVLVAGEDQTIQTKLPSEKLDELENEARAKFYPKRALARIPFNLGKDIQFSVGVYNLVRKATASQKVKLYKKTNEAVKTNTRTFHQDTGEMLMPQDMKKFQTYAGRKISFENEEVVEMKKFDSPGLKLMGFKPISSLKPYMHIKPAQFLYPDESNIEGSTTGFLALLKKCLEKSVIAVCRYIPRRNTPPRFVALLPQEEQFDDENQQDQPPGFHLIFLPFSDDCRNIKFAENVPRASHEQTAKAKDIIKRLKFDYKVNDFENPALQTHYAFVEAMALERDEPQEVKDNTAPNEDRIDRRAGRFIQEFKDLVFPAGYVPGAKRKTSGSGGAASKRPKIEVEVDMEKEARAKRLGKLTVNIMKEFVKKHKIQTDSQRKADLIDAISDHFGV